MSSTKEFPFHKARRVTSAEVTKGRKAIEAKLKIKRPSRRGRPPKASTEKYVPISLRLHPSALTWLKRESKIRKVPYQTIINELLLKKIA